VLLDTTGRTRPHLHLEPAQTGVVVGLQAMLDAAGLILVCPRCLSEGGSHVIGDVDVTRPVWRLECGCTIRVLERKDAIRPFDADGDLIASADSVLRPLSLAVRCPEPRCVNHPLEIERTPAGVVVRCRCAKTTFKTPLPTQQ
jgi:hypothetical protein